MQPHPTTSVMQLIVTVAAVAVAACAIIFTAWTMREHRNADLVKIGVSVLRVDPDKDKQISEATREWALNLIDANAGGVKFSPEARAQLLRESLKYSSHVDSVDFSYPATPEKPTLRRPSNESLK